MPGLFVAAVPSGAQVMTTIGSSPEPPVVPGMTPQPAVSDAQAARAAADRTVALTDLGKRMDLGRKAPRERRLPVMVPHHSATSLT
ncbi:hypothetical protein GCM10010251_24530 [Streptomyces aurantiogriseus]|uniref:Uncharacterized protein n=1 Tax=Streptomyces aurantiogriseus TaxID=66870 RepID=A0A918C6I5_9ACTN|nr:hypothetical protein GCM10010251_24530 [Streptomyces aurantiogriseus]